MKIKWDYICKSLDIVAGHSKLCQDIVDTIIFVKLLFLKLLLVIYYYYCFIAFNYLGLEGWVGENQGKGGDHIRQRNRMCERYSQESSELGITGHLIFIENIYSI